MRSQRTLCTALILCILALTPIRAHAAGEATETVAGLSGGCGADAPSPSLWNAVGDPPLYRALITGQGATIACLELIHDQYRQTGDAEAIEGVPSWLSAEGPLHLISTWDVSFLPFQLLLLSGEEASAGVTVIRTLQAPNVREAKRIGKAETWTTGVKIEADLLDVYRVDPVYTRISALDAEEAVYVWPDPAKDASSIFIERRLRPIDDYRIHLEVTLYNFGEQPIALQPALEVHAWERPGTKQSMFSPPPDLLQSMCQAGGSLTREDGGDLAEEGVPVNPAGEAEWIGVGGRYFFQALVNRKMPKAACQLYASTNGVASARMYRPLTDLDPLPLDNGCVPFWLDAPGRVTCKELASRLGMEREDLSHAAKVEEALKANRDLPEAELKRVQGFLRGTGRRTYAFELYVGPKDINLLKKAEVGLEDSIDFWIVGVLAKPMLQVLKWCYSVFPSWTLAIILLTVLVKLLLLPLTQKSFGQMQRMASLKPQMDAVREKYGKDKARLNQEMMNLYKREKVNPLGGCLPMLLQMPIWIALYRTIYSSAELYQAPMGLWIHDLSAPDPYFVMPLLLGGLMFLQQKMTPTATDSQQAKMMLYIMPVMFTLFMLFLPAGLNLYILVNTMLSLVQQYYLKRKFTPPTEPAASRA
ncbi:MAG: membrane protein insertase YidC [Pseudomonadota bacterium]